MTHYNISIVIPCYPPHIKYLAATFNDIINQTVLPTEVILAISNTDESNRVILMEKFNNIFTEKNIKFIVVANTKTQYAGINRNMGANIASNEYIMFIDADDNIHPGKIEITKYFIEKYNADVVLHSYKHNHYRSIFNKTKPNPITADIISNDDIYKNSFKNNNFQMRGQLTLPSDKSNKTNIAHGYPTVKKALVIKFPYPNLKLREDCAFLRRLLWNKANFIHIGLDLLNIRPTENKKI